MRYEQEELLQRPLPLVQVETSTGLELKGVREILERCNRLPVSRVVQPSYGRLSYGRGEGRGGGGRGGPGVGAGGRFSGYRDNRRWSNDGGERVQGGGYSNRYNNAPGYQGQARQSGGGYSDRRASAPPAATFGVPRQQYPQSTEGVGTEEASGNVRKLSSYVDIDAPQVSGTNRKYLTM